MQPPSTHRDILLSVQRTLSQFSQWRCPGFDCSDSTIATTNRWSGPAAVEAPKKDTLATIRADMGDCHRCRLDSGRRQIVFGEGDAGAQVVFVGHGPGADEDQNGRPFSGAPGQLLDRIIEAMKLSRDRIYLCDVIKCRTPEDRIPVQNEIHACRPFWQRQIAVIRPQVICTLGACATRTVLDTTLPLSELRGRFHDFNGIKVMPTFHPADLLENPDLKRAVWEDVKKIMALLRIPL